MKLRILKKPESGVKHLNTSIVIYQPICHPQVGVEILVKHQIGFTTDTSLGFQIQGRVLIVKIFSIFPSVPQILGWLNPLQFPF